MKLRKTKGLDYSSPFMAAQAGFEPTDACSRGRCLAVWRLGITDNMYYITSMKRVNNFLKTFLLISITAKNRENCRKVKLTLDNRL